MKLHPMELETIRRMDLMLSKINNPFFYSPSEEDEEDLEEYEEENEEEE